LLITLLVLFLALLIKAAAMGRHVYVLWKHAQRMRGLAYNPLAVLEPQEASRIRTDLAAIEGALGGLRGHLRPLLRPTWLPWQSARANLMASDTLLKVAVDLSEAGQVAAEGLQCIVDAMPSNQHSEAAEQGPGMSEALFAGLVCARPHFAQAAPIVGQSAADVATLMEDDLWSPLSQLVPLLEYYLRLGSLGLVAASDAPALLGELEPASYLILAQNNDELRATGGWITGIGLLTLERGKISELTIRDSYDFDQFTVDHPYAPEPMQRYMDIILWVTRDGNWSPDFPTAAQDVEDLYHLENSADVNGIVAFDMHALQFLVQASGPIYLEEYQDRITGSNVIQKAREYWNPPLPEGMSFEEWAVQEGWKDIKQEWWLHRKDFMGLLAEALLANVQGGGQPDQLSALLWAAKRAIDEKHILLYFHEPSVQRLLGAAGMDGALDYRKQEDYLLVLDTNMGYNKVNLNVDKSVEYEVILADDAAPQANLAVTYRNRSPAQPACILEPRIKDSYEQMAQDCYWNYLRVYAPAGAQLLSTEGVTETDTLIGEQGQTVFAAFFVVPAAGSKTVRFSYQLPHWGQKEYHLLVQKQAGTDAVPLKVRIIPPEDSRLSSAEPNPHTTSENILLYDLDLRQDRSIGLSFR
jgi:hypothetical protein